MKKKYVFVVNLLATGLLGTAQIQTGNIPERYPVKDNFQPVSKISKTQSGAFAVQLDPLYEILTQKGITTSGTTGQMGQVLAPVFMDSTVSIANSQGALSHNISVLAGSIFDPTSTFLQNTFQPIVSKADPYTLDSVFIRASYIKKTAAVDTLYAWLVWGDSTNTSVFTRSNTASIWVAPMANWRKSVISPKIAGATGAAGNKVMAAAPASNMKLVKYVLTSQDSVSVYGRAKFIGISLGAAGLTIPAGNIVSCLYTFVPGGTHTLNQAMYSLSPAVVPTINGFCGIVWEQNTPQPNSPSDNVDYMVEGKSWNMGIEYGHRQRHAMYPATYNNNALGSLTNAAVLVYSLKGISTVSTNELTSKGFLLGQNVPNPYTGEAKVSYILDKEASSCVFSITDVTGRVLLTKTVETGQGTHNINMTSYPAGIYYYSLNVDGKIATRKMIVQ